MPVILVSGAAHGLGAEFVKAYQRDEGNTIIAIDIHEIKQPADRVRTFAVDVSSQESIDSLASNITDTPIDLVIHSAGVRGLVPDSVRQTPGNVSACENIEVMDLNTMIHTFQVNTAGTFMLLRTLLPNLRMAAGKVIMISSRMGSIGNNQKPNAGSGGAYAYRASKAAVNAVVRSFAADVPDVTFVLCHPGRVETKLVQWKEEGAISAEESVNSLLPLIANWKKNDSGKFYDRFGEAIPW